MDVKIYYMLMKMKMEVQVWDKGKVWVLRKQTLYFGKITNLLHKEDEVFTTRTDKQNKYEYYYIYCVTAHNCFCYFSWGNRNMLLKCIVNYIR